MIYVHQVSAVRFEAFRPSVHQILTAHHATVGSTAKSVNRSIQKSATGRMVPKGARVAAGGYAGDAYVMYANMSGASYADVETLFHHAYVSEHSSYVDNM
jgi:hypothetical protein